MSTGSKIVIYAIIFSTLSAAAWVARSRFLARELHAIAFSEFISIVDASQVARVDISDARIVGITKAQEQFQTRAPRDFEGLTARLMERKVRVHVTESALLRWLPLPMLLLCWIPMLVMGTMMVMVRRRL